VGEPDAERVLIEIGPPRRRRVIGRLAAGVGIAVAWAVASVVLGTGGGLVPPELVVGSAVAFGLMSALPTILLTFRTTVTVGDRAITIKGGPFPGRGTWRWADLLEVCLTYDQRRWVLGLRPQGTVWDVPGPQVPAGTILDLDDDQHARVRDVLEAQARQHGVHFSEERAGIESPPPGSSLRSDAG